MTRPSVEKKDLLGRLKTKVDQLAHGLNKVTYLRANNSILNFSARLSGQLPVRSKATEAYNSMVTGLLEYEALKLYSLWDKPDKEKISVPAVLALLTELQEEPFFTAAKSLKEKVEAVSKGKPLKSLKAFRDVYLGHNLDRHLYDIKSEGRKLIHNDIRTIYFETVPIVDSFCKLVQDGTDFSATAKDAETSAKMLWHKIIYNPNKSIK